jgi:uncharacterized membrane protein YdjX (TVP38/TMEM64 family)
LSLLASPGRRALRPLLILCAVAGALVGSQLLRARLGVEWSPEAVRAAVGAWGWWAPAAYLALVLLRQLLALPSLVVLTAAGLLFGAALGAVLGGVGIVMNACLLFGIARIMGRDWVLPRLHERFPDLDERARTAGPPLIAFMTGHPMGVITPFHFAAGATGIRWTGFFTAVAVAGPLRAACYSYFGANLLDPGSRSFWAATALLVVVSLAPLAHPGVRRRLFARGRDRSAG